jgi:histidinol dehydrogenase
MKKYTYNSLSQKQIEALCQRNNVSDDSINAVVSGIMESVKANGDAALINYSKQFDNVDLEQLYIGKSELEELAYGLTEQEQDAINVAYNNIYTFHKSQLYKEAAIETFTGVTCWREPRAIEKVGLYVPGGTAVLPSTMLMLAIPATIAGCNKIVVCSPPQKNGLVNKYIAYCAILLGIEKVYLIGGAQAIAAMAYGTATVPKVDKIFGPGNRYVTNAKSLLQAGGQVAIDMPAGPSEVLVIADDTANPVFVAADLLSQAEHGTDSQVVLVSTSETMVGKVMVELEKQLQNLDRAEVAKGALSQSYVILVEDLQQAMAFSNAYAPEHLIMATDNYEALISLVKNAGSVFLGHYTPEAAGDYASGTNHTLPTSGFARNYSGVSVDSFIKKITFQHITQQGINKLGPYIETLADIEGLKAHKNAVTVRL